AALSWIESELEDGKQIPAPLGHFKASGTYLWRPPRSLHARAIAVAAIEGVSLNQYITTVVAENIGARSVQMRHEVHTVPVVFEGVLNMDAHFPLPSPAALLRMRQGTAP